jgi:hypothetical protein
LGAAGKLRIAGAGDALGDVGALAGDLSDHLLHRAARRHLDDEKLITMMPNSVGIISSRRRMM